MALFKISKGTKANLNSQTLTEGYCWFTPEDGKFYIDAFKNEILTRIPLNAAMADSVAWTNITGRPGDATSTKGGILTDSQAVKLAGIATGAEVNQNAFSNIKIGSTTVAADAKTDTVEFTGSNITISGDATNDKVIFSLTSSNVTTALGYTPPQQDTTYSAATQSAAGLMSAVDKKKLDGIATGAQVNVLESVTASGTAPLTLTAGAITNKSIAISGAIADATTSAKGIVKIGDGISVNNGTISVTASGLGLSSAMLFKGSLGAGGTITSLPTAAAGNTGYTYKVITAGTYASQAAKVGDVFVSDGSQWVLIPSGDEPSGTVTSVGISNATNGGLTVTSSPITTSGTISIGHTNVLTNAQTTQALYPIKIDKNGHISAYGTAVTSLPASDVSAWAKAASKPTYALSEITSADDLKAIEALSGTTGILKKTAANTWTLDTTAYTTNTGTVTSITLKAGTGISLDIDNTAITGTGTRTITNAGVTGIKGNAESTYRTGQINLTAAHIGAIPADIAGNTQDLVRPTQLNGLNDVTLDAKINDLRANRLAFLPADQIIIEKTTDGGTTWIDAEISDATKLSLFSETRPNVALPLLNGTKNVNCGLRITFTAMKYNVPAGTAETQKYNYWNSNYIVSTERYNQLKEMYFWVSANSDTISVKAERATGANSTTWIKLYDSDENSYGMTGWSGNDYISFSQGVFGGGTNQTGNYWNYRLTFFTRGPGGSKTTLSGTNTSSAQSISEIRGYGDTYWTAGNSYAAKDHLYSFDYSKNATFPAQITATAFNGNATSATNATNIYSSASTSKAYVLGTTTASSANHATVYNASVYTSGSVLFGAAWNDYAEYRITKDKIEAGRCVIETGHDDLILSSERLQPGAEIVSDTFGFAIGETKDAKTPIATTGRALAYIFEGRAVAQAAIGRPVCSGPNGTVSIMTDEEYQKYGYCAIGTISAVPDYEKWGEDSIKVNGRVWIRIR